jgi:hypothetical protein
MRRAAADSGATEFIYRWVLNPSNSFRGRRGAVFPFIDDCIFNVESECWGARDLSLHFLAVG